MCCVNKNFVGGRRSPGRDEDTQETAQLMTVFSDQSDTQAQMLRYRALVVTVAQIQDMA